VADLVLVRRIRAIAIVVSLVIVASASAEPRIEGPVSQEDVRGITSAIRAITQDRIVVIRKSSQPDSAGVQTASGPTAGCQYFVRRITGTWKIMGKSCWTHVGPAYPDAEKRWPRVARPSGISDADFPDITAAVAKVTHDAIRTMRVTSRSPLTVQVHATSPHIVTERDYTLQKVDGRWKITKQNWLIH
jgi:hypothetical protein